MVSSGHQAAKRIAKRVGLVCLSALFAIVVPAAVAGAKAVVKAKASQAAAKSGKPTVLDFGAAWCVPCKKFAPTFEKVKGAYGDKADFQSIDADSPSGEKLTTKYGVSGLPTIIILDKAGKEVFRKSGLLDEPTFTAEVTKVVGK